MKKKISFKNSAKLFLLLSFCIGILFSCKKKFDRNDNSSGLTPIASPAGENTHIFSDASGSDYSYTELGRQYASVFNVENVKNAWNALSPNKITILQPNHLYIKFTPANPEELSRLSESGLPLYTYPLDYEVIRYGDYMRNPDLEPNGIPSFYTCLPAGKSIPDVSYELLDKLYLLDLRSVVAKKAFALAGESAVYPGDPERGEEVPPVLLTGFDHLEHHSQMPDLWERRYDLVEPPPPPPPPPPPADNRTTPGEITNACNCSQNEDDRKPSGCISVQETRFGGFQGVNDVLVEFGGPFFQRAAAVTNRFGCFKSNIIIRHKIFGARLQVAMRVDFVTDKKTIRGINHGNVTECTMPLTVTIHDAQPGGLNNESVIFYHSTDVDGNGAKFYTAATVNNAIYEFDYYARQDGLPKLNNNLKVMVHKYAGSGATPMFHKLLSNGSIPTASLALFATAVGGVLPVAGGMGNLLNNVPPDVMIGYDYSPNLNWFETDQIKEVSYHEFAHVLHYQKAGNGFWEHEIDYVIERLQANDNPPYGSPGAGGAGRCDLVEMWGVYLGKEYAHRRYGPDRHSRGVPIRFANSWYGDNELVVLWDGDGDNTPANNHIPGGFLQDIRDDNTYNTNNFLDEAPGITDNIGGYATSTIYSHLSGSTTDAATLMDQLAGQLPTGNTLANFNTLRAGYGY